MLFLLFFGISSLNNSLTDMSPICPYQKSAFFTEKRFLLITKKKYFFLLQGCEGALACAHFMQNQLS